MAGQESGGEERPIFLRCSDRFGREVVIYQDRWYEHIMVDHGELFGYEETVRATIEQPDAIRQDRFRPDRACYYRQGDLPRGHRYVKVIIELYDTPFGVAGTVITAFTVEHIDLRETHIW